MLFRNQRFCVLRPELITAFCQMDLVAMSGKFDHTFVGFIVIRCCWELMELKKGTLNLKIVGLLGILSLGLLVGLAFALAETVGLIVGD
ncbi:hypothetical protein L6452_22015 [Arctium lappa]|uniref:Uncharacterized protein n=1 Tax=Arctium lappa TaxID=4217 RepID=A0ACB9AXT9_ARCLA|nr:hypothetical protein L6452_22015 [Arctium lappa]